MGAPRMPADQKRSHTVGIRLTAAQYQWLVNEAQRQTKQLGFKVTLSAIATKLFMQAMNRA